MTAICMDDRVDILNFGSGQRELTWGKKYEVMHTYPINEYGNQYIIIINDIGIKSDYLLSRFAALEDFRKLQLDRLEIC